MTDQIQNIRNEAVAQITSANSVSDLEEVRINYLGRNGKIADILKTIGKLTPDERRQVGVQINETKKVLEKLLTERKNDLKENVREWFDPTIPGKQPAVGTKHLITQAITEIENVFKQIGFSRLRYPEVEWDWYSFTSLNFDEWHPARDEWETFFVDTKEDPKLGPMILTPQTSSGQVREMKRTKPPIRMLNIAKCYRRQSDVSHTQMFHQFEGLVVDTDISIANLVGTLDHFAKSFFGPNRKIRLRPYDFVFTEPSFEVDIDCDICDGKGCKVCKGGWLELAGAGLVHPNVLKNGGIDPKEYSGFAFGVGVERVLMMKSGLKVPDLRLLYSTDLRFLRQF